jgi:glycosyltransferase involved in cell wall biosynthesis
MNSTPGQSQIDFIVPAYNEAEGIGQTCARLTGVLDKLSLDGNILIIDDGSTDNTWPVLKDLSRQDSRIKLLRFSRNFGHQAAITAGLAHSNADYNLILDADLQDPPELLEQMLPLAEKGYEVIYGVRATRAGESGLKKFTASLFYRVINLFSPYAIPLDAGDFRLVSARARELFLHASDKARLNREIWAWIGLKQIGLTYHRPARAFGTSKYNWNRMLKLALDGLTATDSGPIMLLAGLTILLLLASPILMIAAGTVAAALTFTAALLLAAIAIVGFYTVRLYAQSCRRPSYLIAETITNET